MAKFGSVLSILSCLPGINVFHFNISEALSYRQSSGNVLVQDCEKFIDIDLEFEDNYLSV